VTLWGRPVCVRIGGCCAARDRLKRGVLSPRGPLSPSPLASSDMVRRVWPGTIAAPRCAHHVIACSAQRGVQGARPLNAVDGELLNGVRVCWQGGGWCFLAADRVVAELQSVGAVQHPRVVKCRI
jgi:hypothetical protein